MDQEREAKSTLQTEQSQKPQDQSTWNDTKDQEVKKPNLLDILNEEEDEDEIEDEDHKGNQQNDNEDPNNDDQEDEGQ